ncbi:MAG: ankyrin repeat domain-containing protein [Gemmatimonadota bacterium]
MTVQGFIDGIRAGDFSRMAPAFEGAHPLAQQWDESGALVATPDVRAEALTCACFLGEIRVAEYFLAQGIDPAAGAATGLNAFHWAANRGQLEIVRLLIQRGAPLESRSMYDGTVLGTAVWAAVHEPRPAHAQIVEDLLRAGARVEDAEYPSGDPAMDALLRQFGASEG